MIINNNFIKTPNDYISRGLAGFGKALRKHSKRYMVIICSRDGLALLYSFFFFFF